MHPTQRDTMKKLLRVFLELSKRQQRNPQQSHAPLVSFKNSSFGVFTKATGFSNLLQQCLPLPAINPCLTVPNSRQSVSAFRFYSKFTAAREQVVLGTQPLSEDRAHDLIANLKDSERSAIKLALEKYESTRQKEGYEGKLAATRWRSRFGRPSKIPALGEVDPTGSFCAFPDDWLKKKAAEKAIPPTSSELLQTFFVNAVPFVAFGFLDNFTMIIAGDYIEHIFGLYMCISTMAAAGLGNTISDILGIGSAFYVERACEFVGLKPPDLTPIQMEMKSCRRAANLGRIIGITVGCLIGMFPLLVMDKKGGSKETKTSEPEDSGRAKKETSAAVP